MASAFTEAFDHPSTTNQSEKPSTCSGRIPELSTQYKPSWKASCYSNQTIMEGVDTPSKPSAKDVGDDETGIVEIASKNGDLVLHIEHGVPEPKIHSFKVSTTALKKSKYFERLLEAGRFGEGQQVASQHDILRQKFQEITLAPATELPSIRIVDLGRISAVKSTRPLLTDFFLIMHDKDTSSPPPVSNLANLAIVADRFDALATVRTYVRRKKFLLALDAKTQPKAEASLSEERVRQRFLVALLLDHAPWIERYSARLINRGWVGQEADVDDPLWWDLPGRVEEELAFRRDCILETIQSLQSHFLALYSSRARQCRLGYDSSPECDSFQFGEIVRFFLRAGTLSLTPTILPPEEPNQPYEGDILALLDRLKQIPEYQVDRNHSHCGIRTRLVPLADLLGAAATQAGLCGECWAADRSAHSWMGAKRPLKWVRAKDGVVLRVGGGQCGRRHVSVRDFFMATERDWSG